MLVSLRCHSERANVTVRNCKHTKILVLLGFVNQNSCIFETFSYILRFSLPSGPNLDERACVRGRPINRGRIRNIRNTRLILENRLNGPPVTSHAVWTTLTECLCGEACECESLAMNR